MLSTTISWARWCISCSLADSSISKRVFPQRADVIRQERFDIDHVGRQVVRGPPGIAGGKLIQRKPADQRKARQGAHDGLSVPEGPVAGNLRGGIAKRIVCHLVATELVGRFQHGDDIFRRHIGHDVVHLVPHVPPPGMKIFSRRRTSSRTCSGVPEANRPWVSHPPPQKVRSRPNSRRRKGSSSLEDLRFNLRQHVTITGHPHVQGRKQENTDCQIGDQSADDHNGERPL